jgi:hypothetical protein
VIRDWAKEEAGAKAKEKKERESGLGCCQKPAEAPSWKLL